MRKFVDGGEHFTVSSFHILKVPFTDDDEAVLGISKTLCEDCCYLSSEGNGQTSVELLRVAGSEAGSDISHYITVRTHDGSEQDCVMRHEAMIRGMTSCLRLNGYVFEEITFDEYRGTLSAMNSGNVWALKKQDVIEYGTQDTYKAPSIVEKVEWENIYSAITGSGCGLCIQIIPSMLTDKERNTVRKYLLSCTQAVNGIMPNMHDQLASDSAERWKYYAQMLNRPFAEVNILISGPVSEAALLTARIRQSAGNTQFSSMPVPEYDTYSIYNQPWKVSFALRNAYNSCLAKWSSEEISRIFMLPSQEKYFVGVEANAFSLIPETTSISKEMKGAGNTCIPLGKSVHSQQDISIPIQDFKLHTAIYGKTSGGKTTLLQQMIPRFYSQGINVLILEPVKQEFRDLFSCMDESRIFTVEKNTTPLLINPFYVPEGVSLKDYKSCLSSAFKAAISMPDPLPSLFPRAINEAYLQFGWTDSSKSTDKDVTVFDMADFIRVFKRVIEQSTYSNEVKGNMMSGGAFRLQSLLERCPHTFDTIHSTSIEDVLTGCTVLEMGSLEPEQKSLVSALMLISILAYFKATRASDNHLMNIILIDEAHAILDQGEGSTQEEKSLNSTMTQLMMNVITEIRACGVGVIISDQSPSRIGSKLFDNVDNVISFRLSGEEANMLADHIGLDEKERKVLPLMSVGEFIVKNHTLTSALAVSMNYSEDKDKREHATDSEIAKKQAGYLAEHAEDYRPFPACEGSGCIMCSSAVREEANMLATQIFNARRSKLSSPESIASHIMSIPDVLAKRKKKDATFNALCKCVAIHLIRKCSSERNISLSKDATFRLIKDMEALLV